MKIEFLVLRVCWSHVKECLSCDDWILLNCWRHLTTFMNDLSLIYFQVLIIFLVLRCKVSFLLHKITLGKYTYSLGEFKIKICKLKCDICLCRLQKEHLQNLGSMNQGVKPCKMATDIVMFMSFENWISNLISSFCD